MILDYFFQHNLLNSNLNYEDNEMIFDRRTCKKELQDSVLKIIDVHNKVEIQNDDVDKVKGQNGEVQKDDVDKVKFQNGEVHENEIEKVAVIFNTESCSSFLQVLLSNIISLSS
jgi:hypothetical protein